MNEPSPEPATVPNNDASKMIVPVSVDQPTGTVIVAMINITHLNISVIFFLS